MPWCCRLRVGWRKSRRRLRPPLVLNKRLHLRGLRCWLRIRELRMGLRETMSWHAGGQRSVLRVIDGRLRHVGVPAVYWLRRGL